MKYVLHNNTKMHFYLQINGNLRVSTINFNHKEFYHSEAGTNQADNLLTLEFASKPVNNKTRNYSPYVTFIEQE